MTSGKTLKVIKDISTSKEYLERERDVLGAFGPSSYQIKEVYAEIES